MKKLNYMFVCLLTFYLAGMYRYLPLMVLAVLESIVLGVSFVLPYYFRGKLSVEVLRHKDFAQKMTALSWEFKVVNRGILPVNSFRVKILTRYGSESSEEKKYIYGGSGSGESTFRLEALGEYCGMMYLRLSRLKIYDYLSLFSVSRKIEGEVQIAVFPGERALRIELPSLCCQETALSQERMEAGVGEAYSEVRQLREYHTNDTKRYIHWNQSARRDRLGVKEYEKESDAGISLFLNLDGIWEAKPAKLDAFYELLSALLLGLLAKISLVRVYWYDVRMKCLTQKAASDIAQCRNVMLALYQMEGAVWEEGDKLWVKGRKTWGEVGIGGCFQLNLELGWYRNEVLIYQFSGENLSEEMDKKYFVV